MLNRTNKQKFKNAKKKKKSNISLIFSLHHTHNGHLEGKSDNQILGSRGFNIPCLFFFFKFLVLDCFGDLEKQSLFSQLLQPEILS